ncbi:MAG: hypothetical protein WBA12_09505 [Catalinimonas sp.]
MNRAGQQWLGLTCEASALRTLALFGGVAAVLAIVYFRGEANRATGDRKHFRRGFTGFVALQFFLLTPITFFAFGGFEVYCQGAPLSSSSFFLSTPLTAAILLGFGATVDLLHGRRGAVVPVPAPVVE